MDNEQLVIKIKASIDVADNMLALWQQNRGFIHKIVNQYKAYAEEEDLEQEGYLGLSAAVDHYNPDEGVTFIHYASFWIKQYIARYIRGNGTVRLQSLCKGESGNIIRWFRSGSRTIIGSPQTGKFATFSTLAGKC